MMRTRKQPPSAFNKIPRRAGKFWSYQAAGFAAMEHQPLFIYAAMFDEVDEGTAMFKAASTLAETPAAPAQFLYLSVDGTSVPSDFYLSLSGNFTANWRHKRGAAPNASSAEAAVWGDAERRESYELARRLTEHKLAARLAVPAKTDDDGADETAETPLRPHLVFVLADDLGWNDIGFHDARVLTPTLTQLATDGVRFEHHYVYRYCSPTRGSFLSGRLPHHDHQSNPGGESAWGPNTKMTLLPAKLKAEGYRTAMRGKWHYGFSRPEYLPKARGFDDHAGYLQGACDHLTEETGCAVDSWRSDATYSGPDRRNNTGYDSWRHASDMVEIIRRPDPRPLFLYAALHGAKTAALTCACDAKSLSERVHVHSRAQPDRGTRRVSVDLRDQPARLVHQEAEDCGDG
eukprot:COSAG04_NODE_2894_length_3413_cov_1.458057_2_plen_403_part_00